MFDCHLLYVFIRFMVWLYAFWNYLFFYIFILRLLRVEYGKRKSWWWWIVKTIHKLLQYYQLQLHIFTIYSHVNVACICLCLYGCWASLHQIRKISIYTNVFYLFTRPNLVVFYLLILCEFLNQTATLQVWTEHHPFGEDIWEDLEMILLQVIFLISNNKNFWLLFIMTSADNILLPRNVFFLENRAKPFFLIYQII